MSHRNDTNLPYDLSLLSGVPDPTREVNQVDRHSHPPPAPDRLPTDQQPEQLENVAEPALGNVPWFRTGWGIVAIAIAIVLIIGVITGGAVGGTHHSSKMRSDVGESNPMPNSIIGGDSSNSPSQSGTSVNPPAAPA